MNVFVISLHVMDALKNKEWEIFVSNRAAKGSALAYTELTQKWLFHGITEPSPERSQQELWLLLLSIMDLAVTVNTDHQRTNPVVLNISPTHTLACTLYPLTVPMSRDLSFPWPQWTNYNPDTVG